MMQSLALRLGPRVLRRPGGAAGWTALSRRRAALHSACPSRHGHNHHRGHSHSSHVLAETGFGSEATRVTVIGAAVNLALGAGKGIVGVYVGSAALIADGGHSLTDIVSDVITLAALRVSAQPPDSNHPYGHGRVETLASLGISALLIATAAGVGVHSLDMLTSLVAADVGSAPPDGAGEAVANSVGASLMGALHVAHPAADDAPYQYAAAAALASLGAKEALFHWTHRVAVRTGSDVLLANAWHHRSDSLSSIVALVGIGGGAAGLPYLDPLAGLAVAAMIGHAGVKLAVKSVRQLSDEVDPALTRNVADSLVEVPGVSACSLVRARPVGSQCVVDAHLEVADENASLSAAHQLAERARHNVLAQFDDVLDIAVHVRPQSREAGSSDGEENPNLSPPLPLPLHDLHRHQHDIEADVRDMLSQQPGILSVTHMNVHYAARGVVVEVSVEIRESLRVADAHAIARRARDALLDVEDVADADIHLELHDR